MKILLLGKDGHVGWELQRSLSPLGELHACGRSQADLEQLDTVSRMIDQLQPDVIVNAAAYTAVDKAEADAGRAFRINADAPGLLAQRAAAIGAWLVHYSTDYVFDGTKPAPYCEDDEAMPLSVYGRSKLEGEQAIRAAGGRHLILRTSWIYAAHGANFAKTMLRLAKERDTLSVVADQHGAPTSAALIADVTALLLHALGRSPDANETSGIYHLAARGEITWHAYARYLLQLARDAGATGLLEPEKVLPIESGAYPAAAARPKNSRLNVAKLERTFGLQMPDWTCHVRRLIDALAMQGAL